MTPSDLEELACLLARAWVVPRNLTRQRGPPGVRQHVPRSAARSLRVSPTNNRGGRAALKLRVARAHAGMESSAASGTSADVVLPALDGVTPDLLPDKDRVYYNDYSTLVQQQGMLQDSVRTSLYQFAMLENTSDFNGQTVLDVGAGTGILSFFAA